MSRRTHGQRLLIFLPLIALTIWVCRAAARADNPPCNCGNGQPCVANRMYYGYYPTVWRRWPGTAAASPPSPSSPGSPLPPAEIPQPQRELEGKVGGSSGETQPGSSGSDTGKPTPEPAQNPNSPQGKANQPGPGNLPQTQPLPAPKAPQNLNRNILRTDPQAYLPPPSLVRPTFSQIPARQPPVPAWPPANPTRNSDFKADFQIYDGLELPRNNAVGQAPTARSPAIPAADPVLPVVTAPAIPSTALAASTASLFAKGGLELSINLHPSASRDASAMEPASLSLAAPGKPAPLTPTGPLATMSASRDVNPPNPWVRGPSASPARETDIATAIVAAKAVPSKYTGDRPLKEVTSTSSAPTAPRSPLSNPAAGQPAPTDLFAASPLSTLVLATGSAPRSFRLAPAITSEHKLNSELPTVVLAPARRQPVVVRSGAISSDKWFSDDQGALSDARPGTAAAINRDATWVSLPHRGPIDLLDLRGLVTGPTIAAAPSLRITLDSSPAPAASHAAPLTPTAPQPNRLHPFDSTLVIAADSPGPTAGQMPGRNDLRTLPAAPSPFPAGPPAQPAGHAQNAIYQQPSSTNSATGGSAPAQRNPAIWATDAPTQSAGRVQPIANRQATRADAAPWAVATDESRTSDHSSRNKMWNIDPRTIEDSLASDKQPAGRRLPGDNSLPRGQFQVADDVTGSGPVPAAPRTARQANFQVAQPSGEAIGLSGVDPLAVSRSLGVAPTLPSAPPGTMPSGMAPPMAAAARLPASAPRPGANPPGGMAFATDAAPPPQRPGPGLYAPSQSLPAQTDANPFQAGDNAAARRNSDFSAPVWSQMPNSGPSSSAGNPLR